MLSRLSYPRYLCLALSLLIAPTTASPTCSEETGASAASLLQRKHERAPLHSGVSESGNQSDIGDELGIWAGLARMPGKVLSRLILPDPYPCELAFPGDARYQYAGSVNGSVSLCGRVDLTESWDGLHPLNLSASGRWKNSVRLLSPVGALPCCPTPPHCMAPTCMASLPYAPLPGSSAQCTKPSAVSFFGYMTHEDVWPAYFARGGSSDLDVLKHWDVLGRLLGCSDNSTGRCKNAEPFDMTIDLGADWGSYSERFMARQFGKDFIMVDCVPPNKIVSDSRLGNTTYLSKWYEGLVQLPAGHNYPQFEFLSYALSNESAGSFDICDASHTWSIKNPDGSAPPPCPVDIMRLDQIVPGKLSPAFQAKYAQAQSLYIKMDVDGMDQLAVDGMRGLLNEVRGTHEDGSIRYLVNFMMMEFCPSCIIETRQQEGFSKYDLGTQVQLLESLGFELFLIGPRYIPLSHGSWSESYNLLFGNPSACPTSMPFEKFKQAACLTSEPCEISECMFAADLFAMRASHPRATEIKLALGACEESREFDLEDKQYNISDAS